MRVSELFRKLRRKVEKAEQPPSRSVQWTRTASRNGYVREKALLELAQAPSPEDWPYVLERLNDWVPQVREQAELLAESLIVAGHIAALSNSPDHLSALALKSRAVSDSLLTKIILALSADGNLAQMWPNLGRDFRDRVVRTLLAIDRLPELLVHRELKNLDPNSIQVILREQSVVSRDQISTVLTHSDPETRKVALELAALGSIEVETLQLALFDRSSRVRTTAQFLLGKRGVDAKLIYLSRLDAGAQGALVVEGFCDMATVLDLKRLRTLYSAYECSQRKAIARALCRLEDTTLLIQMLSDNSGRIRRLAFELALKQPGAICLDERQALFQSENLGIRKVGAQLLMSQSRWASLIQILKFIGNEEETISTMALDYLRGWLRWAHRSPTIPEPTTFKRAVAVTSYVEVQIPEPVRKELKQVLSWISSRVYLD